MKSKKNRAAVTAPKNNQPNTFYQTSFPIASKINLLLGKSLLALENATNNRQSRSELLSVVEDLIVLKAELGLLGVKR